MHPTAASRYLVRGVAGGHDDSRPHSGHGASPMHNMETEKGVYSTTGVANTRATLTQLGEQQAMDQPTFQKAEQLLFPLLYTMTERPKRKGRVMRVFVPCLLMIIDFCQLLSLALGDDGGLDSRTVGWLQSVFDLYNSLVGSSNNLTDVFFWMSTVVLMSCFGLMAWITYTFRTKQYQLLPLKILRFFVKIIVTALYIFVLRILLKQLNCQAEDASPTPRLVCMTYPWLLYMPITVIELLVFVPFCILMALVYHDSDPMSRSIEARPHGQGDVAYILVRTVVVAVKVFMPGDQNLARVLLLMGTAVMTVYVIMVQPYYNARMNDFRAGLFFSALTFTSGAMITPMVGSAIKLPISLIFLIQIVPACFLGAWISRLRMRQFVKMRKNLRRMLETLPTISTADGPSYFLLETDVEVCTRFIRSDRSDDAIQDAEHIYRIGLNQFEDSAYVHICYVSFISTYRSSPMAAMMEMKQAWKRNPAFDHRFWLFTMKRDWEQQNHASGEQVNFMGALEFSRLYEQARRSHSNALKLLKLFWKALARKSNKIALVMELDQVPKRLAAIDEAKRDSLQNYDALLAKFPNSKMLLRSYANFLQTVCNETEKAQTFYSRADDIEEQEARNREEAEMSEDDDPMSQSDMKSVRSSRRGSTADRSSVASSNRRGRRKSQVLDDELGELVIANDAVSAVKKVFHGVLTGLILLACICVGTYVAIYILFDQYAKGDERLEMISRQRADLVSVLFNARSLMRAAIDVSSGQNQTSMLLLCATDTFLTNPAAMLLNQTSPALLALSDNFLSTHLALFFGRGSVTASSDSLVQTFWEEKMLPVWTFYPIVTSINGTRQWSWETTLESVWDTGNSFASRSRGIGEMQAQTSPLVAAKEPSYRYVFDNGYHGLLDGLDDLMTLYEKEVQAHTDTHQFVFECLLLVTLLTLFSMVMFVFRPAFARIQSTNRGVGDILYNLPIEAIQYLSKYYGAFRTMDSLDESEDEAIADPTAGQAVPKTTRSNSFGRGDASKKGVAAGAVSGAAGYSSKAASKRMSFSQPPPPLPPWPGEKEREDKEREERDRAARDKDRGRDKSRDRERSNDRDRSRSRGRDRGRDKDKGRDGARDETKERATLKEEDDVQGMEDRRELPGMSHSKAATTAIQYQAMDQDDDHNPPLPAALTETSKRWLASLPPVSDMLDVNDVVQEHRNRRTSRRNSQDSLASNHGSQWRRLSLQGVAADDEIAATGRRLTWDHQVATHVVASIKDEEEAERQLVASRAKKVGGSGLDRLSALTKKYSAAFLIIAAVAIANFAICLTYSSAEVKLSYEISKGTTRKTLVRETLLLARELYIDDGLMLHRDEVYERFKNSVQELLNLHQAIKFGNSSYNLAGSTGRYGAQDDLLYKGGCMSDDGLVCGGESYLRPLDRNAVRNGLDHVIKFFLEQSRTVLKDVNNWFFAKGTSDPQASVPFYTYLDSNSALTSIFAVGTTFLDSGLDKSIRLFKDETATRLAILNLVEGLVLAFNLCFLAGLYVYLFRPMLRQLMQECNRTTQLLHMIPKDVITRVPFLKTYFVNVDEIDDGAPSHW